MNQCPQQHMLVDLLYNELGDTDKRLLTTHLESCVNCRTTFDEFKAASQQLSMYKRPQPGRSQLTNYHRELKKLTQNPSRFSFSITALVDKFIVHPILPLRIVEYAIIFALGIWIGRWELTHHAAKHSKMQLGAIDENMLDNFLSNAEMLLLDVSNTETEGDLREVLIATNLNRMLQKNTLLKEQASQMNNVMLTNFLDDIELILLELANCDGTLSQSELSFIQQIIKDSHIMLEMKSLNAI
ncbi:hypothetical protein JW960_04630 [candidate division KSB1 bacterium]|nr:hypothetical protein [candidate division KSB1 bacterium]